MGNEPARLIWSARWSLTTRILAVNIFAIALLATGFFYLDSYRTRLTDARLAAMADKLEMLGETLSATPVSAHDALTARFTARTVSRLRFYGPDGRLRYDSFVARAPTYVLPNPDVQPWYREAARVMDRTLDWIVGAPVPGAFAEPARDRLAAWPEAVAARAQQRLVWRHRHAPDRTPMLSAAIPVTLSGERTVVLMTVNARDITRTVRAERWRLGVVLAVVTLASVLLSLFLARTIVDPLRRLARAAVRVQQGRQRDVIVPRLPSRRDEIGTLARALSDMTQNLRQRIDAGEHFAADVSHELKNPIASLRSAIEGLGRVADPGQRAQLLAIASEDVRRLDRLVSDISEASRVDAQLSRTRFERIDVGAMIEAMLEGRAARRGADEARRIAFARPRSGTAAVMGDGHRLERAIDNVIDNALSFSPHGGLVCVAATLVDGEVRVRIDDDGPGIAAGQREAIFRRFHSERPEDEAFGQHSGLGLAIARTIIEGHQGRIVAQDREDGKAGASILISLPAAD